ncbi:hypothetical protein JCM8097_008227 [Rhodosporidiobolus ruineniae]
MPSTSSKRARRHSDTVSPPKRARPAPPAGGGPEARGDNGGDSQSDCVVTGGRVNPASWLEVLSPAEAEAILTLVDYSSRPNPGFDDCIFATPNMTDKKPNTKRRPKFNLANTKLDERHLRPELQWLKDECRSYSDLHAKTVYPLKTKDSLHVRLTHIACIAHKSSAEVKSLIPHVLYASKAQLASKEANQHLAPPLPPPDHLIFHVSHLCGQRGCFNHRHLIIESAGDNDARNGCRAQAKDGNRSACRCRISCQLGWALAEAEAEAKAMQERGDGDEDVKPVLDQSSSADDVSSDEADPPPSRQPVNSSRTPSASSTSNRPVRSTRSDASYHGTDGADNKRDSDYIFEDEEDEDEDQFSRQPRTSTASAGPSSSTAASNVPSRTAPLPSPPPGVAHRSAAYDKWASDLFRSHGVSIWFQATQAAEAAAALGSPSPASPSHPTLSSPSRTLSSANKGPSIPPPPAPPARNPYPSPLDSPIRPGSGVNFARSTSTPGDVVPDSQPEPTEEDDEEEATLPSTAVDAARRAPSPSPTSRKPLLRPAEESQEHVEPAAAAAAEGNAADEPSSRSPPIFSSAAAQTITEEDYPTLFGAPPEWPSPAPFPPPTIFSDSPGPSTSFAPTLRPVLVPLDSSDSLGAPPSQRPQERIEFPVEAAELEKVGNGASSGDASAFPSPPRTPTRALSPAPAAIDTLRHASPSDALENKQSGSHEPDAALVEAEQQPEEEKSAPPVPMDLEEPERVESAAPASAVEEEPPRESFAFRAQSEPASEVGDEEWCDAMEEIEGEELVPMSEAAVDYAAAALVGALEEGRLEKEEDEAMQSTEKTEASWTWRDEGM